MKITKVIAVVVTYNRKELLSECLSALLEQTFPIERITVVDNASTDGTYEFLSERGIAQRAELDYRLMDRNLGGAGGFYEGIKVAKEQSADWIWVMDDDTIPQRNSLEKLMDKVKLYPTAGFFASCVKGSAGEPMNVPHVNDKPTANGYCDWYMALERSLVKIKTATFVSILINGLAVREYGLPCKDFFIWGDDIEYTTRLTRYFGDAYLVGDSWACHKRTNAKALDIRNEPNVERIKNYHYFYRNTLIITALYSKKFNLLQSIMKYELFSFELLLFGTERFRRFCTVQKGVFEFVFQYRRFKRIIRNEIDGGNTE